MPQGISCGNFTNAYKIFFSEMMLRIVYNGEMLPVRYNQSI